MTVFGSAAPKPGEPDYQTAYELGHAAATAGWTLCNGGYGGTMTASAAGARSAGGHTIGVTCTALGRPTPNEWIVEEVQTPDLLTRLRELVTRGDAFVVLPGSTGTLLELALVWELRNKRLLDDRSICLLGAHWRAMADLLPIESRFLKWFDRLPDLYAGLGFSEQTS